MGYTSNFSRDTVVKFAAHRGTKRIWLEGLYLINAGFTPDTPIRVKFEKGTVSVDLAPGESTHRVSGRMVRQREIPIIDLSSRELEQALGEAESIRVSIRDKSITFTPSQIEVAKQTRELTKKSVAICAGGGLMSQASKQAGFTTVAAVEVNSDYADIYQRNHPECAMKAMSIEEVDFAAIRREHGPIGLVEIGLPCEPYSIVRKSGGEGNQRLDAELPPEAHLLGDLVFWALKGVSELNPHTVVLEEAPRFLKSGAGFILIHALRRMGYNVDARVFDASEYGALTYRKRAVVVATKHAFVNWPMPEVSGARLGDILIAHDDPRCEWWDRSSKSWIFEHWERQEAKGNGFGNVRRGLHAEDVATRAIKKRYFAGQGDNPVVAHPVLPDTYRWLTLEEVRAIMAVPADYFLGDTLTCAGEIAGQGVHVALFEKIIRSVCYPETPQIISAKQVEAGQLEIAF